jgi:hypothetical protein
MALGLGLGNWNFIVEENIEDSIRLLCEFIRYAAELPKRLPPQCLQSLT